MKLHLSKIVPVPPDSSKGETAPHYEATATFLPPDEVAIKFGWSQQPYLTFTTSWETMQEALDWLAHLQAALGIDGLMELDLRPPWQVQKRNR